LAAQSIQQNRHKYKFIVFSVLDELRVLSQHAQGKFWFILFSLTLSFASSHPLSSFFFDRLAMVSGLVSVAWLRVENALTLRKGRRDGQNGREMILRVLSVTSNPPLSLISASLRRTN
jgi:hypothetical protein